MSAAKLPGCDVMLVPPSTDHSCSWKDNDKPKANSVTAPRKRWGQFGVVCGMKKARGRVNVPFSLHFLAVSFPVVLVMHAEFWLPLSVEGREKSFLSQYILKTKETSYSVKIFIENGNKWFHATCLYAVLIHTYLSIS